MRGDTEWAIEGLPDPGQLFAELRVLSIDGEGVTRAAYAASETAALNFIAAVAERFGLEVARDQAANLCRHPPSSGSFGALHSGWLASGFRSLRRQL